MDKLKSLQTALETAQADLTALQDELPQFHALLTENEQEVQRLKTNRAPLDEQAQARGRVQVAREMLEQHKSDIQNARAEVAKLEAVLERAGSIEQLAGHARAATKHRQTLDKTVASASAALGQALEQIAAAFAGIHEEKRAFALGGVKLARGFSSVSPYGNDVAEVNRRGVAEAFIDEVKATGADVADVLDLTTGRFTALDRTHKPLLASDFAPLLWEAFNEAVAKKDHSYRTVELPVKRTAQPIAIYAPDLPRSL